MSHFPLVMNSFLKKIPKVGKTFNLYSKFEFIGRALNGQEYNSLTIAPLLVTGRRKVCAGCYWLQNIVFNAQNATQLTNDSDCESTDGSIARTVHKRVRDSRYTNCKKIAWNAGTDRSWDRARVVHCSRLEPSDRHLVLKKNCLY